MLSSDLKYESVNLVVLEGAQARATRPMCSCAAVGIRVINLAGPIVREIDVTAGLAGENRWPGSPSAFSMIGPPKATPAS